MTKNQIEVITSVERRRRWFREEKERLVAATFEPGASVSEIARLAGIHVSQLFRWRKELCQISAPSVPRLVPVEVVEALPVPASLTEPPPVSRPDRCGRSASRQPCQRARDDPRRACGSS
ncbi:transposase [Sinorhizobium medicae]|uniref:transposase n=1 Tax=Sinorhizobium medicae TaxID=110321 RepID=UPI001294F36D|nr:transposase [Sinorhizobium medicae]MQX79064.1 transposase [Sinorhizobium medicae]